MSNSPAVQDSATNLLGGLPFGNIIGGPLVAAIQAQSLAAWETVKFVRDIGFETLPTEASEAVKQTAGGGSLIGRIGAARTVKFKYSKNNDNFVMEVPLLTLVPIPFLRISNLNVNFTANIFAETVTRKNDTVTSQADAGISPSGGSGFFSWFLSPLGLKANIARNGTSSDESSSKYNVQYTMNVSVNAVQDSMPAGMQNLLNVLINATGATKVTGTGTNDAAKPGRETQAPA